MLLIIINILLISISCNQNPPYHFQFVAKTKVTQSHSDPNSSNITFRADINYDAIRKLYREDHYREYENTTHILLPKNVFLSYTTTLILT